MCDKSEELLEIECDMASLHTVITNYPSKISDMSVLESYLARSRQLYDEHPPKALLMLNEKWLEKW